MPGLLGCWRIAVGALALAACTLGGPPHPPSGAGAYGQLRLVPRAGVTPGRPGDASYGDRRLRDVTFVDYAHPGFAAVWVEGQRSPAGHTELSIRDGRTRTVLAPEYAAVGAGGSILVSNAAHDAHVVSCPGAQLVRSLAPGESVEIAASMAGEEPVFVLDGKGGRASVFVSPGPFAVTDEDGYFTLRDLPPGRHRLRAWHPRFPPASQVLDVIEGRATRADIEMGVDRAAEDADAAH